MKPGLLQERIHKNLCHLHPSCLLSSPKGCCQPLRSGERIRLQGEPDASGRRSPVPIPGAIETIDIDEVIVSVGVSPNPLVPNSIEGLEVTLKGTIVVNADTLQSSIPDIYAGGDIVRGGATVILAMGDGRRAAAAMHKALQEK